MAKAGAVAAVLLLALLLRLHGVGHDLAPELEPTNAPALDAFWYLEAAQAPADGSRVEALPSYDRPLWVLVARGWFALSGTGIESAQRLVSLLGALSVLGVFLALHRSHPRAALLAALLLATSYPFCGLARTPLIYTPLAAFMAIALALHAREEAWARLLGWALLLGVMGGFKTVAFVAVPGFVLADLARLERRGRALALALGALALAAGLLAAARLDPGEIDRTRERIDRYLDPALGLGSWRRLVLAPHESGLLVLAPGLLGLAAVGATRWRRPVVLACLGWVATLLLALALLRYRPLRFYALSGPPLAILAGVGADALLFAGRRGRRRAPVVAGLVAANAWAVVFSLERVHRLAPGYLWLAALAAPLGVGLALVVAASLRASAGGAAPGVLRSARAPARALGVLLVALTLALDLARDLAPAPTTLVDANRGVRVALGPEAVLGGPYAASLAAGAHRLERRRAPTLYGGPRAADGLALVASLGLTHVALDVQQDHSGQLSSGFARLGEPPVLLLVVPVRHELVLVYRLHSAEKSGYELSAFEKACEAADPGSALGAMGASTVLVEARARALDRLGRLEEARALMSRAQK